MNTNSIDEEILRINDSICRHIKNLDRDGRDTGDARVILL